MGGGIAELLGAWKAARRVERLPMEARRDALDLFTISAADWLERWFESYPIKACRYTSWHVAEFFNSIDAGFTALYRGGWVRIAGPARQVDAFVAELKSWRIVYRWEFDINGELTVIVRIERG